MMNEDDMEMVELLGIVNRLTRERDAARALAAALEEECSRCWGPVHASAVDQLREGEA